MHSSIIPIDDVTFDAEVLRSPIPVLVEVTSPGCGPCRQQTPIVERLARELAGRVRVVLLDIARAPEAAVRLRIRGAPTLLLFAGGRELTRHLGLTPETILRRMLDESGALAWASIERVG